MDFLCRHLAIWSVAYERRDRQPCCRYRLFQRSDDGCDGKIRMSDLVDIAIPTGAQAAAEALGLRVSRGVTFGVRVRQIPREDAEIAIVCLRDWGVSARIVEDAPQREDPSERAVKPAA